MSFSRIPVSQKKFEAGCGKIQSEKNGTQTVDSRNNKKWGKVAFRPEKLPHSHAYTRLNKHSCIPIFCLFRVHTVLKLWFCISAFVVCAVAHYMMRRAYCSSSVLGREEKRKPCVCVCVPAFISLFCRKSFNSFAVCYLHLQECDVSNIIPEKKISSLHVVWEWYLGSKNNYSPSSLGLVFTNPCVVPNHLSFFCDSSKNTLDAFCSLKCE